MQDLKVTVIQTELFWEDIDANIDLFDKKINDITEDTDLIVLPEMFSTGFTMNAAEYAQTADGSAVAWIKAKASEKNADITGSVIIEDRGRYYNRLFWAKPDGALCTYDKEHLFRLAGEEKVYSASHKKITVDVKGWKIRPFICYDLRFPIWTRNIEPLYDVAVFIANWPKKRSAHWRLLLQARAVENQCYVIGVNRVGEDGNGYPHSGDSAIIDAQGKIIFQHADAPCTFTASLSYEAMAKYRKYFPAWMDADKTVVK
ncbi:MAG: amidohydrolase [Desulfobacterales bacterium]